MTKTVCIDDSKKTYYLMAEITIKKMRKKELPEKQIEKLFDWTEIESAPQVMLYSILAGKFEIRSLEDFVNSNDLNKYYICAISYYKEFKEKRRD